MKGQPLGALLLIAAGLFGSPLSAQFGFGQNKIQYRGFDWRVLRGEHVDLYYYPEAEELGRVALSYAEESYRELERRFTHAVTRRVPLIIYASHTDFEQTNILPFVPPEGLLGVTEFLKRRVAMPFNGSYAEFRHTLRHELVHVFQLSLSAELSARYPRQRHAHMPLWWTEGLAEYFSAGEDSRDEMILREMTISGELPSLGELAMASGGLVYPIGGSAMRYIGETYGEWRIVQLYRDLWKYQTFSDAIAGVYGRSLDRLSEEWRHWMRQRYYPAVSQARPVELAGRLLARTAIKPSVYHLAGDSGDVVLYFSPSRGYTSIYAQSLEDAKGRPVVNGERSEQFESFHVFDSRIDVNPKGIAVFSSRHFDRDAVFFFDLKRRKVLGRYQFPELISILSPAWAPDGESVVFSGLAITGYSDLYRLWLPDGRLERLTSDRYEDLDPSVSPDGRTVVFASDRTVFGAGGARNLFTLDLASGAIDYLTYGDWRDEAPRWSHERDRIVFSSDRDGTLQIYSVDSTGTGQRETDLLTGAFDPEWADHAGGFLFGSFADMSFNVYFAPPHADSLDAPVTLAADRLPADWVWPELADPQYARVDATPYERKFTLDFAAGDALLAPGIGSSQGAVFVFSDLLSDHLFLLSVSSFQGGELGNLLDNFNGTAFYLNQARRINWGVGAFRQRGLFYEGDFRTLYEETSYGVFGQVRYPLSRFKRLEGEYRIERSDRTDLYGPEAVPPRREAWLASNFLSYVKDNTLWLSTGPIDGERLNITGGLVSDISHGRFDSYVASADIRKYFRTSLRSAIAVRLMGYHAGGERPRRVNIGGSWGLRGYPQFGYVAGTSAWMVNTEWRFPITNFLSIGFPFGTLRFPGMQGAFFADAGRAWSRETDERGILGSAGLGLRMPIAAPLVLRLDTGYRFYTGALSTYSGARRAPGGRFVDFFFGFNY
jgi:dipeptidyl aminopeptidase/acylaminoacyl peptidase